MENRNKDCFTLLGIWRKKNKDQRNINCSIQSAFHKRVYVRAASSSGLANFVQKD